MVRIPNGCWVAAGRKASNRPTTPSVVVSSDWSFYTQDRAKEAVSDY